MENKEDPKNRARHRDTSLRDSGQVKHATVCALKYLSLENRDCLLTSLWGCENILVLYCK